MNPINVLLMFPVTSAVQPKEMAFNVRIPYAVELPRFI